MQVRHYSLIVQLVARLQISTHTCTLIAHSWTYHMADGAELAMTINGQTQKQLAHLVLIRRLLLHGIVLSPLMCMALPRPCTLECMQLSQIRPLIWWIRLHHSCLW